MGLRRPALPHLLRVRQDTDRVSSRHRIKAILLVNVQMPDSTSVERTSEVMERVERIALKTPGVKHTVAIAGQSILLNANAPNFGAMYVMLDEFHHRRTKPELARRRDLREASSRASA